MWNSVNLHSRLCRVVNYLLAMAYLLCYQTNSDCAVKSHEYEYKLHLTALDNIVLEDSIKLLGN